MVTISMNSALLGHGHAATKGWVSLTLGHLLLWSQFAPHPLLSQGPDIDLCLILTHLRDLELVCASAQISGTLGNFPRPSFGSGVGLPHISVPLPASVRLEFSLPPGCSPLTWNYEDGTFCPAVQL